MTHTERSGKILRYEVLYVVFAFLIGGCGGGGGNVDGGSGSSVSTSVISGVALNGDLSGAVAFYDLNDNGVLDSGEPSGNTDSSGQYSLIVNQSDIGKHKVMFNPDGSSSATASSSGRDSQSTATSVVPKLIVQSIPTTSTHPGVFYAQPIVVKVVDQYGQPIAGVTPTVSTNDNGWVIGNHPTSSGGLASYYWAPGSSASPTATITYAGSSQVVSGTTAPWTTNPNGLANFAFSTNTGSATGYQRDVTPQSDPMGTYYAALNWNQGYAGMQVSVDGIHQLIFSVWDIPGYNKVQIINPVGSTCQTFGGEGTGTNCIVAFPWVIGHVYRFIMTMAPSGDGISTDITCTFTDLATGTVITIGTLRQYGTPIQTSVVSFAEDYWQNHLDCFSVPNRAATYGVPSYLSGGAWNKMSSLEYGNWPPTQYCAVNTYKVADDGSITLYMGGSYQAQSTSSSIAID